MSVSVFSWLGYIHVSWSCLKYPCPPPINILLPSLPWLVSILFFLFFTLLSTIHLYSSLLLLLPPPHHHPFPPGISLTWASWSYTSLIHLSRIFPLYTELLFTNPGHKHIFTCRYIFIINTRDISSKTNTWPISKTES